MSSRWQDSDVPRGDEYDERWQRLASAGIDPHGEVVFVQRYAPRTVLDAGCGTGRVAAELARRGVTAVGVDLDPHMLESARRKAPDLEWHEADLAALDLRERDGQQRRFDIAVAAGNVMIFLRPGTEATVIARLAAHLHAGGRLIVGFQLVQQLPLSQYDLFAAAAGLTLEHRFSTWDGDPFDGAGNYAVSVHRRAP